MLTAGTARAICVDLEVLFVDFHHYVLDLGKHRHRHGRSVYSALRFGVRHALNAMHSALEFKAREHAVARNGENRFLYAAQFRGVDIHVLGPKTPLFGVHFVHTHKFRGKQRGFVAARSRADLDDDVLLVVGVDRKQ